MTKSVIAIDIDDTTADYATTFISCDNYHWLEEYLDVCQK